MGFVESVRSLFVNCFDYSGRASRPEFWYAVLFSTLVGFATAILDAAIGRQILNPLSSLVLTLPGISVAVRRLHDANHSGWWIAFAPASGALVLLAFALAGPSVGWGFLTIWAIAAALVSLLILVWYCDAGTPGPNAFGPSPHTTASTRPYGSPRFE